MTEKRDNLAATWPDNELANPYINGCVKYKPRIKEPGP